MGEDHDGFLTLSKNHILLSEANGYNYTQARYNAGGEAMSPAAQILIFCIIGFVFSCCCVVCICMIIGGDELFKSDADSNQ